METRRIQMGSRVVVFEFEPGWNLTGQPDDVMLGIFAQLTIDYEDGVRPNPYGWMHDIWKKWTAEGDPSCELFRCHVEPSGARWEMSPKWSLSAKGS